MENAKIHHVDVLRKHLSSICDSAALDDDERFYFMETWQPVLEGIWSEAFKTVKAKRATEIALEITGDPVDAARKLRDPWWYRLAFHHRLQAIRLLLIVIAGISVSHLHTVSGMWFHVGPEGPMLSVVFHAANSFLGGICAVFAYWSRTSILRKHEVVRIAISVGAVAVNIELLRSFVAITYFIATGYFRDEWLLLGPLFGFACFSLFLCEISLIAELCDLPSRKPSREEGPEVKPDVFAKIAMPFVWIARRLL